MGQDQLALFIVASLLITLSPGPDVLATLSLGMFRGWKPAVGFGVGCGAGCLLHTALAVLGISALIRSSPTAFLVLKLLGGAYLLRLAWGAFRSTGSQLQGCEQSQNTLLQYFVRGLTANAVNPKVAIFFISFMQPFVDVKKGHPEFQLGILGVIFTLIAILVFATLGFFSGQIGQVIQKRPGISVWMDRLTGVLFLVLAVLTLKPEPAG